MSLTTSAGDLSDNPPSLHAPLERNSPKMNFNLKFAVMSFDQRCRDSEQSYRRSTEESVLEHETESLPAPQVLLSA